MLMDRRLLIVNWAGIVCLLVLRKTLGGSVAEDFYVHRDVASATAAAREHSQYDARDGVKLVNVILPRSVSTPNGFHMTFDRGHDGTPYVCNHLVSKSKLDGSHIPTVDLWSVA